jgi:hypothetical protein
MNRTRVALLGLLAVLLAVWVSSASLPSAPAETAAARAAREAAAAKPAPLAFDVTAAAERLRVQRREAPAPRGQGRNPFEFATVTTPAPPRVVAPPPPAAPTEPAPPPPPPLTLSGIVDKTVGDQQVRTAVISGLGQLFFAKTGDTIATRYEVTAISPDVVELRDIYTKQTTRLALR